jgi:hypothetical protein
MYLEHYRTSSFNIENNLFMTTKVHSTCGEIALALTKKRHIQM